MDYRIQMIAGMAIGMLIAIWVLQVTLFNPSITQPCNDYNYIVKGEWWQWQNCLKELPDGTFKEVTFTEVNGKKVEVAWNG